MTHPSSRRDHQLLASSYWRCSHWITTSNKEDELLSILIYSEALVQVPVLFGWERKVLQGNSFQSLLRTYRTSLLGQQGRQHGHCSRGGVERGRLPADGLLPIPIGGPNHIPKIATASRCRKWNVTVAIWFPPGNQQPLVQSSHIFIILFSYTVPSNFF